MIAQIAFVLAIASMVNASGLLAGVAHDVHAPQPYKFGYSIKDKHGEQHRQEAGNGASGVVGSYGFTDDRGIQRQVNYVADHAGFRAQVKTNEPGTANQDPAAVNVVSSAHPYYGAGLGLALGGAAVGAGVPVAGLGYGAGLGALGYDAGLGGLGYGAGLGRLGYGAGLGRLGYGVGLGGSGYGVGLGGLGYGAGLGRLGYGVGLGGLGYGVGQIV